MTTADEKRRKLLEELRARYLAGTIDEVLIPEGADISELMKELDKLPEPTQPKDELPKT